MPTAPAPMVETEAPLSTVVPPGPVYRPYMPALWVEIDESVILATPPDVKSPDAVLARPYACRPEDGSYPPVVATVTLVASISEPEPLVARPPDPSPVVATLAPASETNPPLFATAA